VEAPVQNAGDSNTRQYLLKVWGAGAVHFVGAVLFAPAAAFFRYRATMAFLSRIASTWSKSRVAAAGHAHRCRWIRS
jgi:hypothetical protein